VSSRLSGWNCNKLGSQRRVPAQAEGRIAESNEAVYPNESKILLEVPRGMRFCAILQTPVAFKARASLYIV
jgi:hypothetical protein